MKALTGGRRTGKTTELIKKAAEDGSNGENVYIVCHSKQEADRIFRVANSMGLKINLPITFLEAMQGQSRGQSCDKIYVDNADYLIRELFHDPVDTIVVNTEND